MWHLRGLVNVPQINKQFQELADLISCLFYKYKYVMWIVELMIIELATQHVMFIDFA